MTLSYHPTHARRLSQQSFTPPLFYSPTPLSIHTDFPSSAPSAFPAAATDVRNAGTVDALFGEWISELEREQIIASWRGVLARDIMETKVVTVNADTSVEEACDMLLSEGIECLVILDSTNPSSTISPPAPAQNTESATAEASSPWIGLFDFSDVNAFLTLAATRHTLSPEVIKSNERLHRIVEAAKAGRVDVRLVSDFSDKNPYIVLAHDANLVSVLEVFARGAHRVFIENMEASGTTTGNSLVGMISDKRLLSLLSSSSTSAAFQRFTSKPLYEFSYAPLNLRRAVVAVSSVATVIDAMRMMSEERVSSIAVVDEESGMVIGGVSATDVGRVVVPSQSNQILGLPLKQFVTTVKLPDGWTDGADKYPVYSVFPSSLLVYTIEKLLASACVSNDGGIEVTFCVLANARRLFVTDEEESVNPTMSPSSPGNLTGVISILDVLSLFAHLARISNVDPRRMQRHRRASSTSSSSTCERELFLRTRSNSRASIRQSPSFSTLSSPGGSGSSPVRGTSPIVCGIIPDIGGALGGSVTMGYTGKIKEVFLFSKVYY